MRLSVGTHSHVLKGVYIDVLRLASIVYAMERCAVQGDYLCQMFAGCVS